MSYIVFLSVPYICIPLRNQSNKICPNSSAMHTMREHNNNKIRKQTEIVRYFPLAHFWMQCNLVESFRTDSDFTVSFHFASQINRFFVLTLAVWTNQRIAAALISNRSNGLEHFFAMAKGTLWWFVGRIRGRNVDREKVFDR